MAKKWIQWISPMLAFVLAFSILGSGMTAYAEEADTAGTETETESYYVEEALNEDAEDETGTSLDVPGEKVEAEDASDETEESTDEETVSEEASNASISINATEVTIYGLDTWAEDLISIPSDLDQSYQLKVTGASSVTYKITSGDSVTIDSSGNISPSYTTWYWSGGVGTTWVMGDYTSITVDGDYGTTVIQVTADSTTFTVTVNFVDYAVYYADQVMQAYVDENITSSMSTYEKVETITAYVAETYNYDASYSSATGMIVSGGGDCWASSYVIISMCDMAGLEAWLRNGNRDSGSGSGHRNVLVADEDTEGLYYEAEAGYDGTAPRYYSITTRTSLFSYRYVSGGIEVYQYDGNEEESGTLVIPSTIDGYTVVSIGEYFIQGEDWDGVDIPDTVTTIDNQAFYYCENLTSIDLPSGLTTLGDYAINGCSSLTSITLPASLTSIGSYNFYRCTSLTAINVESGNTAYCSSSGVLYNKAKTTLIFYPLNKSGTSFTVPSTVTTIAEGAFFENTNLTSITLQSGLTTIEGLAFQNCDGLTSITIPSTVTSIGTQAFCYCDGLTTVNLSEGLTTINGYVFYSCTSLTSIEIPQTVTSIGNYAFSYSGLTAITFLGDAPELGNYVFNDLTLTVYYPCSNSTWTSDVTGTSYGESSITWSKNHNLASGAVISSTSVKGTCSDCGSSITQTLTMTLSKTSYTYTGAAKKPTPTVTVDGTTLVKGTDYTVSYKNNTSAGTGTVTITGTGDYTGSASATFTINQKSVSSAEVTLSTSTYTYNGSSRKPTPTVVVSWSDGTSKTLTKGTDYTVSYSNNKSAGTATVTIKGTGNYKGSVKTTFTINQKSIASESSAAVVTLSKTSYTYNGSAKKPTPTVKITLNGSTKTLTKNTDYTVSYKNNTSAGTATVTIKGTGNYKGTLTKTFTIKKQSLSSSNISLSSTSYTYNGNKKTPTTTVKNSAGTKLTKGTDYTITYSSSTRKSIGKYTVTIKGKGNYSGTVKKTYTIKPAKATISSAASSSSKKITVKWKKVSGSVTGYQIRYRVKGTSTWTTKSVSASSLSKTLSSLKSGKKYQIQVRAYKTVSGTKYYGTWSTTKTVTCK